MKRIILTSIVLTLLMLSACTSNNGDIGPFFGRWQLKKIECQGSPEILTEGTYFLAFQNNVALLSQDCGDYVERQIFGSWHEADNTLFMEFDTSTGSLSPQQIGLPDSSRTQILEITHRHLVLTYHPDDDTAITYYFDKW